MDATPPLAGHVGREQTFEALGRTWRLARWDRAVWRAFLEWAKDRIPDPRKTAAEFLAILPNTQEYSGERTEIVRKALDDSGEYLSPTSKRVGALLGTIDGVCKLFELLLKPAQPDVTEDLAYEVILAIGQAEAERLAKGAAGVAPAPKGDGASPACPSPNSVPAG